MNAKEMFESLGYKYSRNYIKYYGDEVIEYYKTEGVKFVFSDFIFRFIYIINQSTIFKFQFVYTFWNN